jgi:hypothetical protein
MSSLKAFNDDIYIVIKSFVNIPLNRNISEFNYFWKITP